MYFTTIKNVETDNGTLGSYHRCRSLALCAHSCPQLGGLYFRLTRPKGAEEWCPRWSTLGELANLRESFGFFYVFYEVPTMC